MLEDATVNIKISDLEELMNKYKPFHNLKQDILELYEFKNVYNKCIACANSEKGVKCLFCDRTTEGRIYTMTIDIDKFLKLLRHYELFRGLSFISPDKINIIYEGLTNDRIRN